jgi:membrane protein DedA with SNARE-associated domain
VNETLQTLLTHGYAVLFAIVLVEQVGLPIPAVPVLLGVGALAGLSEMSLTAGLAVALVASLLPDLVWYELGRRRGGRVLGLLCRISLEPDSCVRRTEGLFVRRGWTALVVAKFLPGLSTLAPPLAGIVGISRLQFIALDGLGAVVWAGAWMGLGYIFSDALALIAASAGRLGNHVLALAVTALALYVLVKYVQRRRFYRSLRIARITPDEVKGRLDAGDGDLIVIDTRSPLEVQGTPYAIPGALWIPADDIDRRRDELPAGAEIVLYCT